MGYILPDVYKSIAEQSSRLPEVFIETGTFKGGVPHRILEKYGKLDWCFKKYYTIELGEDICAIASKRYKNFERGITNYSSIHTDEKDEDWCGVGEYFRGHLTLFQGSSVDVLDDLLPTLDESCCFWLDAHAGVAKYARGEEDCPLLSELKIIEKHLPNQDHIIAIDDVGLFGKKQYKDGVCVCDYSEITLDSVQEALLRINSNFDIGIYKPFDMSMIIAYVPKQNR